MNSGENLARSLDGKLPSPKPETEGIDTLFNLQPSETKPFSQALGLAVDGGPKTAAKLITAALVPAVYRVMKRAGAPADIRHIYEWFETEWVSPGSQETEGPLETLRKSTELAEGSLTMTVGYTIKQV